MYNPSFSGSIQFRGLNFNACFIFQFCMFRFKCMRLAEFFKCDNIFYSLPIDRTLYIRIFWNIQLSVCNARGQCLMLSAVARARDSVLNLFRNCIICDL